MIPPDHNDQDRDLDRLLLARLGASAEPLTPSSGFTQSAMDAVREESTAPDPIPFPWKRVVPFALAVLCILAAFAVTMFLFKPAHQPQEATVPVTVVAHAMPARVITRVTGRRHTADCC